jgi:HPt (histidine-containing phosphotransfer) domain-containing protein
MMEDLQAAFLPRFLEAARARITRALAAVGEAERDGTAATLRDLHSLAGEAGLLGLSSVLARSRVAEDKARALVAARTDDTVTALRDALGELSRALDDLVPQQPKERMP